MLPYPDKAEERENSPEERHEDSGHGEEGQDDDIAPPVLLLFALAGPPGEPHRHPHHQDLSAGPHTGQHQFQQILVVARSWIYEHGMRAQRGAGRKTMYICHVTSR